jgi:hypothetical protein
VEPLLKKVLDDALSEAWSARPQSPVIADDRERDSSPTRTRQAVAYWLRRLADRIESRPRSRHAAI